jgi:DNA-binding transcriptional MerR regulator
MTEPAKTDLPEGQEHFKLNEVCKLANVQPYMLRFWGTEFEQLETTTTETGQRLYSRSQMGLILEIRRLLFDEGLTIAGARREVENLLETGKLDLGEPTVDAPPPKKKAPARKSKPKAKASKAKPKKKTEPAPKKKTEPEVDKAPSDDVQTYLTTLRGVRKELAEIVEGLKAES